MIVLRFLSRMPILGRLRGRGFTLLELLVTVVVVGILASLALIRFGAVQERAYVATMQSDLRNFATARALYVSESDVLPDSAADVTGHRFSELVFPAGYQGPSSTEWTLVVGHQKTGTRCSLSTESTEEGSHRIACAEDLSNVTFQASTSGSTVVVDASGAIQQMAFLREGSTGWAAWAANPAEVALVSWEFGDGTTTSGSPSTTTQAIHTYTEPGEYQVQLTLVSTSGQTVTGSYPVSVASGAVGNNQVPSVAFSFSPLSPTAGDTVSFQSTATDPDGDPLKYYWWFDDGNTSENVNPTHVFTHGRNFRVTVAVVDGRGGWQQAVHVIRVNGRPQASFTVSPLAPAPGETVTFESTSTEPDGDPLMHSWSIGGQSFSGSRVQTSLAAGTHLVELEVSDGRGGVSRYQQNLTVQSASTSRLYGTSDWSLFHTYYVHFFGSFAQVYSSMDGYAVMDTYNTGHSFSVDTYTPFVKMVLSTTATTYQISQVDPAGKRYTFRTTLRAGALNAGKDLFLCMRFLPDLERILVAYETSSKSMICNPGNPLATITHQENIELLYHELVRE